MPNFSENLFYAIIFAQENISCKCYRGHKIMDVDSRKLFSSAHNNFTQFLTVINGKMFLCKYNALSCRQEMEINKNHKLKQEKQVGLNFNYDSSRFLMAPGYAFIGQGTVVTVEFCSTKKCLPVVSMHKLHIPETFSGRCTHHWFHSQL